jgi:hypothetical protein
VASAVSIEAAASAQQSQFATIPAIPLPSNITDYVQISSLVALMPPVQAVPTGIPTGNLESRNIPSQQNESELLANLIPPHSNLAQGQIPKQESLAGRSNPIRILIVGDSMTQGREGDYTWRYRIWDWFQEQGIAATFVGPYIGPQQQADPQPLTPPPL